MKTFITILLFGLVGHAESELRSKAISETTQQTPGVEQKAASDAQITDGVLSLEDPTPQEPKRSYDWIFGLKVQNFQPSGILKSKESEVLLSDVSSYYLPSLEAGIRRVGGVDETAVWHWGVLGHAGYASQESEAYWLSLDSDSRLNTLISDLGLYLDYEIGSRWGANTSFGIGSLTYSHTGGSSFSQFSKQATFRFAGFGFHVYAPAKWQIFVNYMNRNLTSEDLFAMPTDSVELGTRYVW
jgi:hypothetical protein